MLPLSAAAADGSALATAGLVPPTCSAQWRDIGTLGGTSAGASGLNDRGEVVGYSETADGASHPFYWRDGVMTDLSSTGLTASVFINNRGDIAGATLADDGIYENAALWRDGRLIDLGSLGGDGSNVRGMNQRGDVIGVSGVNSDKGFLWQDGTMTELRVGELGVFPNSINDQGDVAGSLMTSDGADGGAALWRGGRLIRLVPPFGVPESAVAGRINNRGQVLGVVRVPETGDHGFLWTDGHFADLGPATVWDLNDRGEVALIDLSVSPSRAARWYRGALTTLPDLGLPGAGLVDINDRGQILGLAGTPAPTVVSHGVVWTRDNVLIDLGPLNGVTQRINERGLLVGYTWPPGGGSHPVVADPRCL
jgi:probable HAF family extracellular repeat protein